MHRVAGPHHGVPGSLDGADERRQVLVDLVGPEPRDEGQAPGRACRVEPLAQRHRLVGRGRRADLDAQRVAHPGEEFDMGAVQLTGAVTDPEEVGRAVEPVAAQRVHPGQALLVGEDQGLVAGPEVDLVQSHLGAEVDAAGGHEAQRPVDLRRDALVAQAFGRGGDELLVPQVDLGQVGEAALGEGAQQVERGGRLLVCRHQSGRVRTPGLLVERLVVHHVAAERGKVDVADALGRGRARLGELARDTADLDHRHPGGIGQRHRHLQNDLQLVADGVSGEVGEGLGAVAGLQQEGPAVCHLGQLGSQAPGLTGENQRGEGGELHLGLLERLGVGPLGLLRRRELPPRRRAPR